MDFAILRSHFWYRLVLFFCSFTKLCVRGPYLGSFFEVFCIRVAGAQSFGFNETFWLMATGRATVPNLYAGCLNKCSCNCLFVARAGLCCGFCDFAVSFLVKCLFFVLLLSCACGRKNWDRPAVPFLGPCLSSFFEVFCIRVAEA